MPGAPLLAERPPRAPAAGVGPLRAELCSGALVASARVCLELPRPFCLHSYGSGHCCLIPGPSAACWWLPPLSSGSVSHMCRLSCFPATETLNRYPNAHCNFCLQAMSVHKLRPRVPSAPSEATVWQAILCAQGNLFL